MTIISTSVCHARTLEDALEETGRLATALAGQQGSEDQIPQSLPGQWKISLCIRCPGHAWLRFESLQSGRVVKVSRFQTMAGGRFDWTKLRYRRKPVFKSGLWMNRELGSETGVSAGRYAMLSVVVNNPTIHRGQSEGRGHGSVVNNCATYCRDAWEEYTGERYEFNGLHSPTLLRNAIIKRHPQVLPPSISETLSLPSEGP